MGKPPKMLTSSSDIKTLPLLEWFVEYGESPAVVTLSKTISYDEFGRIVTNFRRAIEQLALPPASRVAVTLPVSIEYLAIIPALWLCGHTVVPISERFPSAKRLQMARSVTCDCYISNSDWQGVRLPGEIRFVSLVQLAGSDSAATTAASGQLDIHMLSDIIFTSGSSGHPKGAAHTLRNHYFSAIGSYQNIAFGHGDRWLLTIPLYHVGGFAILMRAFSAGGAIVLADLKGDVAEAIRSLKITHASFVATQFYRLMKSDKALSALTRLKAILLGGSAIPEALISEAAGRGLKIHTSYGATEMSSQITTTPPGATTEMLRTAGRVLPYRELKIAADGEILVKGAVLFAGYWQNNRALLKTNPEGWLPTGDIGFLNDNGELQIIGRKDNMFISGGENIQPEKVERHLLRHPDIRQAIVVAMADEEYGRRPIAFIDLIEGNTADRSAEIAAFLREQLPGFMVPDQFRDWPDDLPENALKIKRKWFSKLILDSEISEK